MNELPPATEDRWANAVLTEAGTVPDASEAPTAADVKPTPEPLAAESDVSAVVNSLRDMLLMRRVRESDKCAIL